MCILLCHQRHVFTFRKVQLSFQKSSIFWKKAIHLENFCVGLFLSFLDFFNERDYFSCLQMLKKRHFPNSFMTKFRINKRCNWKPLKLIQCSNGVQFKYSFFEFFFNFSQFLDTIHVCIRHLIFFYKI
jgi:hypothetical protein